MEERKMGRVPDEGLRKHKGSEQKGKVEASVSSSIALPLC